MDHLPPINPSSNSEHSPLSKKWLLIHLLPAIGFFPSLWIIYSRHGSREQLAVSRLSVTLALTWIVSYLLLTTAAATSDFFSLRLLLLNSFMTSGYFLVSLWLMLRLLQGKSSRLPGFSNLAERVLRERGDGEMGGWGDGEKGRKGRKGRKGEK